MPASFPRLPLALLGACLLVLAWSAHKPHDYLTWGLEVAPAVAAFVLLAITRRRFPLTPLAYILIAVHAVILMVGGKYTYSEVPVGNWFRDQFDLSRNHYDRLGHFVQGVVPAIIAREVLLRRSPLRPGAWLFFLVTCVCITVGAVYEIIEWWTAVIGGGASESFLGAQGDVWDAQKDMGLCGIGAVLAQLLLSKLHDRQLARLDNGRRG